MKTTPRRTLTHVPTATERDPRWAQVVARDVAGDGRFWYSVATTGVYCRVSCASRLANPLNVRFHASIEAARAAGFRACKRCRPDDASTDAHRIERVARACRLIDAADEAPSLAALARAVDLSPQYFHRVFRAIVGVTPKQYYDARRVARVRAGLAGDGRVTDVLYDAGFNSDGRFYASSDAMLGMTPTAYRAGGADARIRFAVGACSLGSILVAQSAKGIVAIEFGDDPEVLVRALQDRFPKAQLIGGDRAFEKHVATVVGFVEQPARGLDLPLDVRGTAFQQRVWQALREIPPGRTVSYRDVATRIGEPTAVRGVAQACAANRLAVAVPCHRVVRTDGALSGYRWGVERKAALLEREAA